MPVISTVTPNSASMGTAGQSITITGLNFVQTSTVQWNGGNLPTTYMSDTELTAQVNASLLSVAGNANVSVFTPSPGGGNSGSALFVVSPSSLPAPTLNGITPTSAVGGTTTCLLTVNGSNFVAQSVIRWNGIAIPTVYLSDAQLQASIPAANLANAGYANIDVYTPGPGGGSTAGALFTVSYAAKVLSLPAKDMVWDALHAVLYLSVSSLAGTNGNAIVAYDPVTGSIRGSQFAGSEPDRLALSDDDSYLYASVDGASAVQRFELPNLTPDVKYSVGADNTFFGPYYAVDLQIAPGNDVTTAVSRSVTTTSPWESVGGVAVFDNAVIRPTTDDGATSGLNYSLQWGSDTLLFGANTEVGSFNLYNYAVDANGVMQTENFPNVFGFFYATIHYDRVNGYLYSDDGFVTNPTTGIHISAFNASGLLALDQTANRAYFLGQTASQSGTQDFSIEEFDLSTYQPIAEIAILNVQGNPFRIATWGTGGLVFNDDAGFTYILNAPFTTSSGAELRTPANLRAPVAKTRVAASLLRRGIAKQRAFSSASRAGKSRSSTVEPNPSPVISSLIPNAVAAGDNGLTLTVTGNDFVSLSTVQWNGQSLPTQFISSSELQTQVALNYVALAGSASITVTTPGPGGGNSSSLPFTVVDRGDSIPSIGGLIPNSAPAGSSSVTVQVTGAWIDDTSQVYVGGSPVATNHDAGAVTFTLGAAQLATPGFVAIQVMNSNGMTSGTAIFQVQYQPAVVAQSANAMVWDAAHQSIYLTTPSDAKTHANQVCALNPATGVIGACVNGNEPDSIAISDDGQFLYVGMDGSGTVQRYTLPDLTADISYSLGTAPSGAPYYALDLQVQPGAPHTTAVVKGIANLDPRSEGGITIYDDDTPRSTSAPGWNNFGEDYDSIQWNGDGTQLYASETESSEECFYQLNVNASGVTLAAKYPGRFWNPGRIHYDKTTNLVYSDDGFHIIDPSDGMPVGLLEVGGGWPMAPDSNLGRVFMVSEYAWQGEGAALTLDTFDINHFVPLESLPFAIQEPQLNPLGRFIRWGANGLAVNFTGGNIYLLSGSMVNGMGMKQIHQ